MKSVRFRTYPEEYSSSFYSFSPSIIIRALKPFFNLTRVLLGIPNLSITKDRSNNNNNNLNNSFTIGGKGGNPFLLFISLFLLLNQIFLLSLKISKGEDFVKKSGPDIVRRVHLILILLWSLIFSKRLSEALESCQIVEQRISKVYSDSKSSWRMLRTSSLFWTLIYLILSLLLGFTSVFFNQNQDPTRSLKDSFLNYGEEECAITPHLVPFALDPLISSLYCLLMEGFISNFLWLFGDFLLLLLALGVGSMFLRINENGIRRIEPSKLTSVEIDLVREHHGLVGKMVKDFDSAISSLNLLNIIFNSAYIILSIYSLFTLRRREALMMSSTKIWIRVGVCAFKMLVSLVAAAVLHYRAHEGLADVRSWPIAREFHDFTLNSGRASLMHAFVTQLSPSSNPTGFTLWKITVITGKVLFLILLGIGGFMAFSRITISSCSRNRSS